LCKKREWLVPALPATPLTDVSASVPPDEDAIPEDTVGATSDSAVRAKEAEVMPVIGALNIVSCSLNRLHHIVSTSQVCHIGSLVRDWAPFYPLRQGNTSCQVSLPSFPSRPLFLCLCPFPKRYVIANDLSLSATTAMTRNVELNGLGGGGDGNGSDAAETGCQGKVRVNQGDAR
jgi:hypothetical protein